MDFDIWRILDTLPGVIIGFTIHEFAHAFTALKLGDSTAKDEGRVSLNPLVHIDWLGFVFIIITGFGWAKPVRFDETKLKHPRRDTILIALAGPVSNALVAFLMSGLYAFLRNQNPGGMGSFDHSLMLMIYYAVAINWGLFVFNLLPIPPLDGSHILFRASKVKPELYAKLFRYGSLALFGLVLFLNFVVRPENNPITHWTLSLTQWTLSLFGIG